MTENREIPNLWSVIALHLLPGIAVAVGYGMLLRFSVFESYPRVFVLSVAVLIFLVPIELGILHFVAKKKTGSYRLRGILGLQKKMSKKAYSAYTVGLFIVVGVLMTALKPVTDFFLEATSQWMPSGYILVEDLSVYSDSKLILTLVLQLLVLTLIGPIVEELFFRGYLLAHIKWLGALGVLLNTLLFSLYHMWSPWLIMTRLVAMLPLYWVVYKKDSLLLAILVHCLCNFTDVIALFMLLPTLLQ